MVSPGGVPEYLIWVNAPDQIANSQLIFSAGQLIREPIQSTASSPAVTPHKNDVPPPSPLYLDLSNQEFSTRSCSQSPPWRLLALGYFTSRAASLTKILVIDRKDQSHLLEPASMGNGHDLKLQGTDSSTKLSPGKCRTKSSVLFDKIRRERQKDHHRRFYHYLGAVSDYMLQFGQYDPRNLQIKDLTSEDILEQNAGHLRKSTHLGTSRELVICWDSHVFEHRLLDELLFPEAVHLFVAHHYKFLLGRSVATGKSWYRCDSEPQSGIRLRDFGYLLMRLLAHGLLTDESITEIWTRIEHLQKMVSTEQAAPATSRKQKDLDLRMIAAYERLGAGVGQRDMSLIDGTLDKNAPAGGRVSWVSRLDHSIDKATDRNGNDRNDRVEPSDRECLKNDGSSDKQRSQSRRKTGERRSARLAALRN